MNREKVKISEVKPNPNNPRLIKDDKFAKLVDSLRNFPEMAEVRPIVVNTDMIILGGNMRFRAMKEAGWKTVPVQVVDWPEDKQREFIIKDNVSGGEWDWEMLANEWDAEQLGNWGLNIPNWSAGVDANNMNDDELDLSEEFDPVGIASGLHRVTFIFDGQDEAESYLNSINVAYEKHAQGWRVNMSTRFTS